MKKTMSIALITIGIILIITGIIILTKQEKNPVFAQNVEPDHISSTIPSELQEQEKEPLPAEKTTSQESKVEDHSSSQTENEQKGQKFEEYVVTHFNRKNFTLKEWRSDKYVKGHYAKSNQNPDLELECHLKDGSTATFAVECKWRKGFTDGKTTWCEPDQLERYKKFIEERSIPTFLAIGIGGTPENPESVYIFNIAHLKGNVIYEKNLERYAHDPQKKFFYDMQKNQLR